MSKPSILGLLDGKAAKSWEVQFQLWVNGLCKRFGCDGLFNVEKKHCLREPTMCQRRIQAISRWSLRNLVEPGVFQAGWLLLIGILVWIVWRYWAIEDKTAPTSSDYLTEFVGLIFDIVFILMIFRWFEFQREKKSETTRHQEVIDDFKRWDSEEAKHRIAGAIRRLKRLSITSVDLSCCKLSDFKWLDLGVSRLDGSNFYGSSGFMISSNETVLQNIDFNLVSCKKVIFSNMERKPGVPVPFDVLPTALIDCSFINSKLNGAIFRGAKLSWSKPPQEELYDYFYDDETGEEHRIRQYFGPFYGANVETVVFDGAHFENADFRDCYTIEQASFVGCTGLEGALFDDHDVRERILANSVIPNAEEGR